LSKLKARFFWCSCLCRFREVLSATTDLLLPLRRSLFTT